MYCSRKLARSKWLVFFKFYLFLIFLIDIDALERSFFETGYEEEQPDKIRWANRAELGACLLQQSSPQVEQKAESFYCKLLLSEVFTDRVGGANIICGEQLEYSSSTSKVPLCSSIFQGRGVICQIEYVFVRKPRETYFLNMTSEGGCDGKPTKYSILLSSKEFEFDVAAGGKAKFVATFDSSNIAMERVIFRDTGLKDDSIGPIIRQNFNYAKHIDIQENKLIKRIQSNFLEKSWTVSTMTIRNKHIEEIDAGAFHQGESLAGLHFIGIQFKKSPVGSIVVESCLERELMINFKSCLLTSFPPSQPIIVVSLKSAHVCPAALYKLNIGFEDVSFHGILAKETFSTLFESAQKFNIDARVVVKSLDCCEPRNLWIFQTGGYIRRVKASCSEFSRDQTVESIGSLANLEPFCEHGEPTRAPPVGPTTSSSTSSQATSPKPADDNSFDWNVIIIYAAASAAALLVAGFLCYCFLSPCCCSSSRKNDLVSQSSNYGAISSMGSERDTRDSSNKTLFGSKSSTGSDSRSQSHSSVPNAYPSTTASNLLSPKAISEYNPYTSKAKTARSSGLYKNNGSVKSSRSPPARLNLLNSRRTSTKQSPKSTNSPKSSRSPKSPKSPKSPRSPRSPKRQQPSQYGY